jgi:hypothetical protein
MKRWLSIRIRQWGGVYTSDRAEEWEDWTCQWKAYQAGDPINQMVRGTWQPGVGTHNRSGTWARENGADVTTGTWEREGGGQAHGTWTEDGGDDS